MRFMTRGAFVFFFLVACIAARPRLAAAQPCDPFNECLMGGTCQPNGECTGTPVPNGQGCNDGNPCTKNDACQAGTCTGVPDMAMSDQPCDSGLGLCAQNATCLVVPPFPPFFPGSAFCVPESTKTCDPTDQSACTFDFCNPQTGNCEVLTNPCFGECGSCDPTTGECTANAKPNGSSCDDFNSCTANDACQGGNCVGSVGTGPTPTKTPTLAGGVATATPTITRTATITATRTATITATRTATRTVTALATSTPTPTKAAAVCFGDCNGSGTLTASDIGRTNSTILRCGPCPGGIPGGVAAGCASLVGGCPAADFNNDGCLRASELSRANQNVLRYQPSGCAPTPTP